MAKDRYKYFRIEARELLDGLSRGLLELDRSPADRAVVARLLRLAHTLKGAARVVHEDAHLVIVDKPPGLVVHPAPGHEGGTLVNALLARCHDLRGIGGELRPGIVHRLDKDTSGLLVVAKDDATMNALGGDAMRELAPPAGGSILTLFDAGGERPGELTPADRTFLRTLYSSQANLPASITLARAQALIETAR